MTIRLAERGVTAVLLDIEGTTTPIAFVHEVLFPFARARLRPFLARGVPAAGEALTLLATEHATETAADVPSWPADPARSPDEVARYAAWLMDRDRKSPGLKLLQGLIWEVGYQAGELRGQVFDDVAPAIRAWREAGLRVAIYSSGSELAQRRLFESTADGDLTPLLAGFFDTGVGAKITPESYTRIAARLRAAPGSVLFVSDVGAELSAARAAGLQTALCVRPGNPPQASDGWDVVTTFAELQPGR